MDSVRRTLYKAFLRRARLFEGVPPLWTGGAAGPQSTGGKMLKSLLQTAQVALPDFDSAWSKLNSSQATLETEIRELTRIGFRYSPKTKDADKALDSGLQLLRFLSNETAKTVQDMKDIRCTHHRSERVQFHVGQVLRHKLHMYHCVVIAWDPKCEEGKDWAEARNVDHRDVFYHVIADEGDAGVSFGDKHIPSLSFYVAQSNMETAAEEKRVQNRHILDHFQAFSPKWDRYVPSRTLQYLYPDEYPEDGEPCNDDANVLLFD